MAEKMLSVEIGYSLTKVCEIDNSGKSPKIYNSFVISTPEGMVRDGAVELDNEFINQFQRMMSVKHIKTRKTIFTVASNRVAIREAVIPYVKDKQIQAIVRANLSEYFPVELSQYEFSHTVLEVIREEAKTPAAPADAKKEDSVYQSASVEEAEDNDKKKKPAKNVQVAKNLGKPTGLKLLILAAPKQLIQSYERLAKAINLELVTIDYNGNSIYQAAKESCKEGVQLIIKVDERSSLLLVLKDGVIDLNRTINYGIDEAIMTLQQCKELGDTSDYDKALEVARRKTVILSSFDDSRADIIDLDNESKDALVKAEKKSVTESLRPLVGGILRVIDYYNSNHSQRPIEKMYVTGIGADFSGLSNILTHEAGLKIKNLTHLAGIDIEKVFKDVTYGEYVACIGASISPLIFYPDHVDEKGGKGGKQTNINTTLVAVLFLLAGLGASAFMLITSLLPYNKAEKTNKEYKQIIEDLTPAYNVYLEYVNLDNQVNFIRELDKTTETRNSDLINFVEHLEQTMPVSFTLETLTVENDRIFLDARVGSKDEVAYVLSVLKTFDGFNWADITSVSEIITELGETTYGFTVEMEYAPLEAEETEEEVE